VTVPSFRLAQGSPCIEATTHQKRENDEQDMDCGGGGVGIRTAASTNRHYQLLGSLSEAGYVAAMNL